MLNINTVCVMDALEWLAGIPAQSVALLTPTAKPPSLCRLLVRAYTPPAGGIVIDPFCGVGGTIAAAAAEGRGYAGCDINADFVAETKKKLDNQQITR